MLGFEYLELVLIVRLEACLLGPQSLDGWALLQFRQTEAARRLCLAPFLFSENPRLFGVGQGLVHRIEVGGGERLGVAPRGIGLGRAGVVYVDDLLGGRVSRQLPFRILQFLPHLSKSGFEKRPRVGRRFIPAFEVCLLYTSPSPRD